MHRILPSFFWLALLFLYLPVIIIITFSFSDSLYLALPIKSFSLKWYGALLQNTSILNALLNSVIIATVVSVLSTAIGTLAAYAISKGQAPFPRFISFATSLPLVLPGVILGVSLLIIVRWIGLPLSLYTVAIGHMVVCVPFALYVMLARLENLDPLLEDASRDLGESAIRTFFRITLPLAMPGIVSSLLLTFTISLDEFVISFFLSSSETTLPIYVWSQLRFPSQLPTVLALGALMLIATGLLITFAEALRHRDTKTSV
jgi:spermidine/putrescine transport system permease protein